jgi:hypothetical protein
VKPWPALAALLVSCCLHAEPYSFAAFGDMPYDEEERAELPGMLKEMGDSGARFAVHVGDFKSGTEPCSDELYADRKQLFDQAPLPVIFVPGENDWLSCQRRTTGKHEPDERLQTLRDIFFSRAAITAKTGLTIDQQGQLEFNFGANMEQLRWRIGPVLYLTLNVPGNSNNWGNGAIGSAEYQSRMAAVRDWIEKSFTIAERESLRGVVIFAHADPDFEAWAEDKPARGFGELLGELRSAFDTYKGDVVFIHGDTHVMRSDRPFNDADGQPMRRFRRVEVYGSPILGWVELKVDPEGERLFRLSIHPLRPEGSQLDQLAPTQ